MKLQRKKLCKASTRMFSFVVFFLFFSPTPSLTHSLTHPPLLSPTERYVASRSSPVAGRSARKGVVHRRMMPFEMLGGTESDHDDSNEQQQQQQQQQAEEPGADLENAGVVAAGHSKYRLPLCHSRQQREAGVGEGSDCDDDVHGDAEDHEVDDDDEGDGTLPPKRSHRLDMDHEEDYSSSPRHRPQSKVMPRASGSSSTAAAEQSIHFKPFVPATSATSAEAFVLSELKRKKRLQVKVCFLSFVCACVCVCVCAENTCLCGSTSTNAGLLTSFLVLRLRCRTSWSRSDHCPISLQIQSTILQLQSFPSSRCWPLLKRLCEHGRQSCRRSSPRFWRSGCKVCCVPLPTVHACVCACVRTCACVCVLVGSPSLVFDLLVPGLCSPWADIFLFVFFWFVSSCVSQSNTFSFPSTHRTLCSEGCSNPSSTVRCRVLLPSPTCGLCSRFFSPKCMTSTLALTPVLTFFPTLF